jgi:hypothetical protein
MQRCAALLAAVLALDAWAVDDYANARFRVLHEAPCLSVWQNMSAQFDDYEPFTGKGYPDDRTYFVVRHMGEPGSVELREQIGAAVSWDPGVFTGLHIPQALRAHTQRGFRDDPANGSSVYQLACRSAGFLINTFSFAHGSGDIECPPDAPDCIGGPQVAIQREFGDQGTEVFRTESSELTMQALVRLPFVHWDDNRAVAQQYFGAYLRDRTTGTLLAWLAGFYDSRPYGLGNGEAFIADDGITTFVSAPLSDTLASGQRNPFLSKSPYSWPMATQYQWGNEERFFRAHLKPEQLREITRRANAARAARGQAPVSTDPADWLLHTIVISAEIAWAGDPGRQISLGGSWRNVGVYEAYED